MMSRCPPGTTYAATGTQAVSQPIRSRRRACSDLDSGLRAVVASVGWRNREPKSIRPRRVQESIPEQAEINQGAEVRLNFGPSVDLKINKRGEFIAVGSSQLDP